MNINIKKLGLLLEDILLKQEKYQMDLVVKEFEGADFLFFYIYETDENVPPTFYFITSPWDKRSNKAPQGAQVFNNGKLILQLDYTEYVKVRTGLMDAFALNALKKDPIGKNILYIGAGGVAEWSLRALKTYFPEVKTVHYKNASGGKRSFESTAEALGVRAEYTAEPDISIYDYIFMHTSSREPVLLSSDVKQLKEGAFISLFSDKKEAEIDVYKDAAILINWQNSFEKESDLIEAKAQGLADSVKATTVRQLLQGASIPKKHHIVFRSGGTPMQNVAMLKYLMTEN